MSALLLLVFSTFASMDMGSMCNLIKAIISFVKYETFIPEDQGH